MGKTIFDIERLQLNPESVQSPTLKGPRRLRGHRRFLKGPIPWEWVKKAGRLPGKALAVGMTLWLWAGMKRSQHIILSVSSLSEMGIQRNAAYRAMKELEGAGLISVVRHTGRKPKVTLLEAPED